MILLSQITLIWRSNDQETFMIIISVSDFGGNRHAFYISWFFDEQTVWKKHLFETIIA